MDFASVYVTAPDEATAHRLARHAVEARLAACANVWPLSSVYRWDGAVHEAREFAILLKTRLALVPQLESALRATHPDRVPCIVAWPIAHGSPPYLAWLAESTKGS